MDSIGQYYHEDSDVPESIPRIRGGILTVLNLIPPCREGKNDPIRELTLGVGGSPVNAQLLVRPDVKHSAGRIVGPGGKCVPIREELKIVG